MAASTLIFTALALASVANGCIHEYGTIQEAQERAGLHFTYAYNGLDWTAAGFEKCGGKKQSPLMLPSLGAAAKALTPPAAKTSFQYGSIANPEVLNNGHTLQVSLPDGFKSDVQIPIRGDKKTALATSIITGKGPVTGRVKATPVQFHFHTHSEHVIDGAQYPLEMHIVHFVKSDQLPACGEGGCPVVLGVMLQLTNNEAEVKPELRQLFEAMPLNQAERATIKGSINLNALLPKNQTYFTYEGSLTAPPCSEGLLWHVMPKPIKISQSLLTKFEEDVGDVMCDLEASSRNTVVEEKSSKTGFHMPKTTEKGCYKLANGHNWRVVQPANNRVVHLAVV